MWPGPATRSPLDLNEPASCWLRSLIFMDLLGESPIGGWATRIVRPNEEQATDQNDRLNSDGKERLEQLSRCVF